MAMAKKKEGILKQVYVNRTGGILDVSAKAGLYKDLAETLGGKFTIIRDSGNALNLFKIVVPYMDWAIILTESDMRPLKIRVDCEPLVDYMLEIGVEGVIEKIMKKLGRKEVEVGDEVFDKHYLIDSNDHESTLKLLDENIRQKILKNDLYSVLYRPDTGGKTAELVSVVNRTTSSRDTYLDLVVLQKMLIDRMAGLGLIGISGQYA
jgi:hypothetical protein